MAYSLLVAGLLAAAEGFTAARELPTRRRHIERLTRRRAFNSAGRPGEEAGEGRAHTLKSDWSLADAVPAFTVGDERPATFWRQLAAATPELSGLTPGQLEARYAELVAEASPSAQPSSPARVGPQPLLLDRWSWADGGRVAGTLESGSTVWVTVAARGFLADDPAAAQSEERDPAPLFGISLPAPAPKSLQERPGGWIIDTGGTVYELGQQVEGAAVMGPGPLAQLSQLSLVSNLASLIVVITGTVGFVAGTSFEQSQRATLRQPSPGVVTQNRAPPRGSSSVVVLDNNTPKAELTLQEQRMRQERRVESQELRIAREETAVVRIEQKLANDKVLLQSDRGRLDELRRVEAERGGDAIVKFP
mmetsp:Transcript_85186/g.241401  ORF Transcript_85186/g.241401 Transcript_85186/m.241401 type:complete len:363 (+) Transcript_85186:167-1255(+)